MNVPERVALFTWLAFRHIRLFINAQLAIWLTALRHQHQRFFAKSFIMYRNKNGKSNWTYSDNASAQLLTRAQTQQAEEAATATANALLPARRPRRPPQKFVTKTASKPKSVLGERKTKPTTAKKVTTNEFPNLHRQQAPIYLDPKDEIIDGEDDKIADEELSESDKEELEASEDGEQSFRPPAKKVRFQLGSRDSDDQIPEYAADSRMMARARDNDGATGSRDPKQQSSARINSQRVLRTSNADYDFEPNASDMAFARDILGSTFRSETVQKALSLDRSLARNEEKLWAMKRARQPRNGFDFAYYKEAVERQYAALGISPDTVFDVGSRAFVDSVFRAMTPEDDPRLIRALREAQEGEEGYHRAQAALRDGVEIESDDEESMESEAGDVAFIKSVTRNNSEHSPTRTRNDRATTSARTATSAIFSENNRLISSKNNPTDLDEGGTNAPDLQLAGGVVRRHNMRLWVQRVERDDELSESEDEEPADSLGIKRQPDRPKRRGIRNFRNQHAPVDESGKSYGGDEDVDADGPVESEAADVEFIRSIPRSSQVIASSRIASSFNSMEKPIDLEEDDTPLAQQVLGNFFDKPVIQQALRLEPALASDRPRLIAMKRALHPTNTHDFAAFKTRVIQVYNSRGLSPDNAFHKTEAERGVRTWDRPVRRPEMR